MIRKVINGDGDGDQENVIFPAPYSLMVMMVMMMILERFIAANNVTGNICDFARCDTFPYSCL